ncbi:unnamed protein product [Discosporangium mesarthrocarpum]
MSDGNPDRGHSQMDGLQPLHVACARDMGLLVKALLAAGAGIEAQDEEGATPLLHACREVRVSIRVRVGNRDY